VNRRALAAGPVDDAVPARAARKTAAMSIEVPVLEVVGLADRLRGIAGGGSAAARGLGEPGPVGELDAALGQLVEGARLAARAIGVECELLGDAAEATARSWLVLDSALLPRRGQVLAR
jgi:hypothetical protein